MKRIAIPLVLIMAAAAMSWSTEPMSIERADVRIWVQRLQFPAVGLDAQISGIVTFDRTTRCTYLEVDGRLSPVIWPAGTRISNLDPVGVSLPGGEDAIEGQSVRGSGGYHDADRFSSLIPDECHGFGSEVAQFNATGHVDVSESTSASG